MKPLLEYIKKRSWLTITQLEDEAGCHRSTISQALKGYKPLPDRWVMPIIRVLSPVKLGGWTFTADEGTPFLFASKEINLETIEIFYDGDKELGRLPMNLVYDEAGDELDHEFAGQYTSTSFLYLSHQHRVLIDDVDILKQII